MRKILIALFVMIIVLVVADRIALLIAERKISDRVASAYDLPAKPGVSIAGFPFLTQVAAGNTTRWISGCAASLRTACR